MPDKNHKNNYLIKVKEVQKASERLRDVVVNTPLMHDMPLSERYESNILLKREDFEPLYKRLKSSNMLQEYLNDKPDLFEFLI